MQPNQLRLGNYLLNTCHKGGTVVKVTLIDNQHIGCSIQGVKVDLCYKFENYKPIILTGRLLQNFPSDQSLKIGSNSEGFFYYTSSGQFIKLQYLHQLQNLYFTLTGEELPVNMDNVILDNVAIATELQLTA